MFTRASSRSPLTHTPTCARRVSRGATGATPTAHYVTRTQVQERNPRSGFKSAQHVELATR
eukprot:995951-Prymnesium_polylepis.1